MIQDLGTMVFHNEFRKFEPDAHSEVLFFLEDQVMLAGRKEGNCHFPKYGECSFPAEEMYYLFTISEQKFFLWMSKEIGSEFPAELIEGMKMSDAYEYVAIGEFRNMQPRYIGFAAVTAYQLYRWYINHQFCGRCTCSMQPDEQERMLRCPKCGNLVYPSISPAIIAAVVDRDRILLTKYAGGSYNRYALVAGFAEIGESLEDTVRREVMEEVGLKIKDIRYYKSQPWSLSGTILSGFYAELDGSDEITLDETELSEAVWFQRESIPVRDDGVSLTREMIQAFRDQTYLNHV